MPPKATYSYLVYRFVVRESLSHQMCRPVCGPVAPFPAYTLRVLRNGGEMKQVVEEEHGAINQCRTFMVVEIGPK